MHCLRPQQVAQCALPLAVMSDDDPDYDTTEQVEETATSWQTSIEVPDELVDWIAEQAHAIEQLTNTCLDLYDSDIGNTRQRLRIAGTNLSTVELDRVGGGLHPRMQTASSSSSSQTLAHTAAIPDVPMLFTPRPPRGQRLRRGALCSCSCVNIHTDLGRHRKALELPDSWWSKELNVWYKRCTCLCGAFDFTTNQTKETRQVAYYELAEGSPLMCRNFLTLQQFEAGNGYCFACHQGLASSKGKILLVAQAKSHFKQQPSSPPPPAPIGDSGR